MFVLTANDSKRKADTRLDGHWRAAQHSTSCHHTYPAVQLWQNSFFCVCSTWWGFNQNNSLTPSVLQWALWNTTQQPNAWTKTKTKGQIALFCSTLGWEVQSGSASTRQLSFSRRYLLKTSSLQILKKKTSLWLLVCRYLAHWAHWDRKSSVSCCQVSQSMWHSSPSALGQPRPPIDGKLGESTALQREWERWDERHTGGQDWH